MEQNTQQEQTAQFANGFKADAVHRTGTITSPRRYIVVSQGEGKSKIELVVPTPIKKLAWGAEFRTRTAGTKPVEQYAFEVDGQTVQRFDDATALVLQKHGIEVNPLGTHQIYVQNALAILKDSTLLQKATVPETAAPATGPLSSGHKR